MKRAREGGMADGQEQLVRNGVLLLVAMLPAAAGLWAISTPFVRLVVSAPFQEMTLQVLPMAIVVGTLRNLRLHYGEQVFLLHEKPMVPLYNDIIDALLAIIGGTVGLWLGGLPGAVTGAAVGACLTLLVTIGCGWHWYRYALPPADIAKVVLATVIMTFAVTRFDIAPTVGSLVLATGMGAVVYAVAIAALYPAAALKALAMLSAVVPWRRARTPS